MKAGLIATPVVALYSPTAKGVLSETTSSICRAWAGSAAKAKGSRSSPAASRGRRKQLGRNQTIDESSVADAEPGQRTRAPWSIHKRRASRVSTPPTSRVGIVDGHMLVRAHGSDR